MTRMRWVGALALSFSLVALNPIPATADEAEAAMVPGIDESFTPQEVDSALTPADGTISPREEAAVEAYLDSENDLGGVGLEPQDLEVGTLTSGDMSITVVSPDLGVSVGTLTVNSTETQGEVSIGAWVTSESDGLDATNTAPTMGAWPSWTSSWHASVRYRLFYGSDYLGDGVFQTFKRRLQSDGSSTRDYWQVSRYGIGRPAQWNGSGPDGPMTVSKLWASQKLTEASQERAKEWMWNLTNPEEGFKQCDSGGGSVTAGPFTFSPSNCTDYDVWTGAIAHQRMSMDQGSWAGGGQRALAYVTGFSIANGYTPHFTWYEFVTLRLSNQGPNAKCAGTDVGYSGGTMTNDCRWS